MKLIVAIGRVPFLRSPLAQTALIKAAAILPVQFIGRKGKRLICENGGSVVAGGSIALKRPQIVLLESVRDLPPSHNEALTIIRDNEIYSTIKWTLAFCKSPSKQCLVREYFSA